MRCGGRFAGWHPLSKLQQLEPHHAPALPTSPAGPRPRLLLPVLLLAGLALLALPRLAGAQGPKVPPKADPAAGGLGGVWYDDTGDGAVEIGPCGNRLCGRIVWLKAPVAADGAPLTDGRNPDPNRRARPICGLDVIGDLRRQRNGSWDEGWIYDPKDGKSYDLELKLRGPDRLVVTGYMGVKFLSETFVWTRAPATIERCKV